MSSDSVIIEYKQFSSIQAQTRFELSEGVTKIQIQGAGRLFIVNGGLTLLDQVQTGGQKFDLKKSQNDLIVKIDDAHTVHLVDFYLTDDFQLLGDVWSSPTEALLSPLADGSSGYELSSYEKLLFATDGTLVGKAPIAAGLMATGTSLLMFFGAATVQSLLFDLKDSDGAPLNTSLAYQLKVNVAAGPVVTTNQLQVAVYGLNGQVLVQAAPLHLDADGLYSITWKSGYSGPVLIRVFDTLPGVDYVDEFSRVGRDLSIDLRAIINTEDVDSLLQTVTVSPLSEMLVRAILADQGGDSGSSSVDLSQANADLLYSENARLASLIGLDGQVTRLGVNSAVNTDGMLQQPNAIGAVLAAISGLEDSMGMSLSQVLQTLGTATAADVAVYLAQGALNVSPETFDVLATRSEAVKALVKAGLSTEFLDALNETQIANLSTTAVELIPPSALAGLSVVQARALIDAQTGTDGSVLTQSQFAVLSPLALGGLTSEQVAVLSDKLSTEQKQAVTDIQVGSAISTAAAALLTPDDVGGLSPAAVSGMSPESFAVLNLNAVQALNSEQLSAVQPKQAALISASQVDALSPTQLAALDVHSVAALSLVAMASFSPEQVSGLTAGQLGALLPAQVEVLHPSAIVALEPAQLAAMSTAQLGALVAGQIAALETAGDLALLSTEQRLVLTSNLTPSGTTSDGVMSGGDADDTFVLYAEDALALYAPSAVGGSDLALLRVDGGAGVDVIELQNGVSLDLTRVPNLGASDVDGRAGIESIEILDMRSDSQPNQLTLGLADVLDMTGLDQFNNATGWSDGTYDLAAGVGSEVELRHQVVVTGSTNDTLDIEAADWGAPVGTVTNGVTTFHVYNAGLYAQLLVEDGLPVI